MVDIWGDQSTVRIAQKGNFGQLRRETNVTSQGEDAQNPSEVAMRSWEINLVDKAQ